MLTYLSLFSGIGGFERAIESTGLQSKCVGYSEIDKNAIVEYERHYPDHRNLGDVTGITKKDIRALGRVDLLVGGFPCNNLSSANRFTREGLDGIHSGLFWNMLNIMKWIGNKDLKILIENNASMSNKWRDEITAHLTKVLKRKVTYIYIDSSVAVPQSRKRYYWVIGDIVPEFKKPVRLHSVLEPIVEAKKYMVPDSVLSYKNVTPETYKGSSGFFVIRSRNSMCCSKSELTRSSRWKSKDNYSTSDKVRCITTKREDNILFDYRLCGDNRGKDVFVPRFYSKRELSRLFGYPDDYVKTDRKTVYHKLFGMTVVVPVISAIVSKMFE